MAEKGWKERMKDSIARHEKLFSRTAVILLCIAAPCCGMWMSGGGAIYGWIALAGFLIDLPLGWLALKANSINVQREIDAIYDKNKN